MTFTETASTLGVFVALATAAQSFLLIPYRTKQLEEKTSILPQLTQDIAVVKNDVSWIRGHMENLSTNERASSSPSS